MLVRRLLRHRLPKVPKFCAAALLKPKDTDDSHTEVTRLLPHVGMDSHEVALGHDTLHLQGLVWVLARVLFHPCQKGLCRPLEKWIVVPEPNADEVRVGLTNLPTGGQFEEGDGGVLIVVCHNSFSLFRISFGLWVLSRASGQIRPV